MAYSPTQDFLALLRQTSGGQRLERMPGLDYVMTAFERAGLFNLWVNTTTPPTTDKASTVWLKASVSSFAVESAVFLYNPVTDQFEPATPALWQLVFAATSAATFQSVATAAANVGSATTLLAVRRDNPGVTILTLPSVNVRTRDLKIADWSTNVVLHEVRISAAGGESIMRRSVFSVFSTPDQLGGVALTPSIDLQGWVIAP